MDRDQLFLAQKQFSSNPDDVWGYLLNSHWQEEQGLNVWEVLNFMAQQATVRKTKSWKNICHTLMISVNKLNPPKVLEDPFASKVWLDIFCSTSFAQKPLKNSSQLFEKWIGLGLKPSKISSFSYPLLKEFNPQFLADYEKWTLNQQSFTSVVQRTQNRL